MKTKYLLYLVAILAHLGGWAEAQTTLNPAPARVLGQLPPEAGEIPQAKGPAPNMLEGRELFQPLAVAVDASVAPPIVYVCDTGNNRVLGWRNSTGYLNGEPADIVLGQPDAQSSIPYTQPALPFFSGLSAPASVAVDSNGNVFVVDAGNNRILRFPGSVLRRGARTADADMIIGQNSRTGYRPNRGGATARNTIRTTAPSPLLAGLAFDPGGNLWVTDAGNHRVLRYARNDVSSGGNITGSGTVEPDIGADLALGQDNFDSSSTITGTAATRADKKKMRYPGAIAFDSNGNAYVSDDLSRVLYFRAPFANGQQAERLLGLIVLAKGMEAPPPVNDTAFGYLLNGTVFVGGPRGLFTIDDRLHVVDTYNHRILSFAAPGDWPVETVQYSPKAAGVFGQYDYISGRANRWTTWEPSGNTLHTPSGAVFAAGRVWVADTGNNRVLNLPNLRVSGMRTWALDVIGQIDFPFRAPNLITGREFAAGSLRVATGSNLVDFPVGPAIAIDRNSDPPRLYVADTGNNRILGFRDARTFKAGDSADLIIGQVDGLRALYNSPYNDANSPTATGLSIPSGVAVDADGNLWVADTGNGRVLMYRRPFEAPSRFQRSADLAIGQPGFTSKPLPEPTQASLLRPVALTFTGQGQLVVADAAHNRVLRFNPPFATGMAASLVLGQPDFASSAAGTAQNQFALPLALGIDTDDRLYVSDVSNRRVQIYNRVSAETQSGTNAALSLKPTSGAMQPDGIAVSRVTGEIFVSDTLNSTVRKFPSYPGLVITPTITSTNMTAYGPRALALDARENLYLVDASSRIAVHYPAFTPLHGASGFQRLAPGTIATFELPGTTITDNPATASGSPLPRQLGDVELLVNNVPAPLMSVQAHSVKYIIPWNTPVAPAAVECILRRVSTGEILASQWHLLDKSAPGLLLASGVGGGAVRAINQDGTPNSTTNAAARGSEVTLFLTGFGQIDSPPEDGVGSSLDLPASDTQVVFGTGFATIVSSSLDPNEPGVWRLRVRLPATLAGTQPFAVLQHNIPSNRITIGNQTTTIVTTIAVKP